MKEIVVAGGCFWGVEAYFQRKDGVIDSEVGYANGHKDDPTYKEVCMHTTGHAEVVKLTYDQGILSLEELLTYYWKIIDPTVLNRQGPDIGDQYRTGIYYIDDSDLPIIEASIKQEQLKHTKKIVTEVKKLGLYFPAEPYHQNYLKKNPQGYCHINLDM